MTVILERDGPIARLRMNRSDVHNAFNEAMTAAFATRVRELAADPGVRAVVRPATDRHSRPASTSRTCGPA